MFIALFSVLIVACNDDDDNDTNSSGVYNNSNGVLVLNEGSSTGSISFIDSKADTVTNNVFSSVNNITLGTYPESMDYSDDYLFVAVTTSSSAGYVLVLDRSTMEYVTSIENLTYPREVTVGDDYAYVSNGTQNGVVYAISLSTLAIADTISVGYGPEKMIISDNKLFVANSCYYNSTTYTTTYDNTVSVIDLSSNTVTKTIEVKDNPKDMVLDADGNIWVYCGGSVTYDASWNASYSNAGISIIDGSDYSVTSYDISIPNSTIKSIAINGDKNVVYYTTGTGLFSMNITDSSLPTTALVESSFYGIDVDPETGYIWCCNVQSYSDASNILVYDTNGTQQKSYEVGIIPNSCIFN